MANPAFFVEGHMEQRFITQVCKGSPVRRIGCNGDQVTMAGMARHLAPLIRLLSNNYPLIVFFDRERRDESCEDLGNQLLAELVSFEVDTRNVVIGVADRTIENWIIADHSLHQRVDSLKDGACNTEGEFGKTLIRNALIETKNYNETTTGVDLLKAMNPTVARQNSPSFDQFLEKIDLPCWWLDR